MKIFYIYIALCTQKFSKYFSDISSWECIHPFVVKYANLCVCVHFAMVKINPLLSQDLLLTNSKTHKYRIILVTFFGLFSKIDYEFHEGINHVCFVFHNK